VLVAIAVYLAVEAGGRLRRRRAAPRQS
jgi:hypothetical protein